MYSDEQFPGKEHQTGDGDTGAVVEIPFDIVPSGRRRKFERVTFRDSATAVTKLSLVVRSGGTDYYMHEVNSPTANLLYEDDFPITVTEGERIVAIVTGSADNDIIDLWASYCEEPLRRGPWDAYGKMIVQQ